MPALGFGPNSNIPIDIIEYLDADWVLMNSPNVDKRITTLVI